MENIYKEYMIQIADAGDTDRDDNYDNDLWHTEIRDKDLEGVLYSLIRALNAEEIIVDNSWLRLIKPNGEIVNL